MDDIAVEAVAQVEQGEVADTADERLLGELEEALADDTDENEDDDVDEGEETVLRQEAVNVLAGDLVVIEVAAGRIEAGFGAEQVAVEVPFGFLDDSGPFLRLQFLLLGGGAVDVVLQALDLALEGIDASIDPLVGALSGVQQLEDGVDRG